MKNTVLKIMSLMLAMLFAMVIFTHYHLWNYLSLDGFNHYHQQILDYEQQHEVAFMLVYIISYIVLIACCVPGTILFDLLAGFIYGPLVGMLLVISCYLFGAVFNFTLVRFFLKDLLQRRFIHLRSLVLRDGGMRRTAYNLIGLRFIPVVPFWILNILAAVLEIPLWIFILTTFLGIIPTSLIYVFLGNSVRHQLVKNQQLTAQILSDPRLWVPLICLALLILVPNLLKAWKKARNL